MYIGAQMLTVMDFAKTENDFNKTIERVAKIGYRYIQMLRTNPVSAKRAREICDAHGIDIVCNSINPDHFINDVDMVIEDHKIMGARYLGIPGIPDNYLQNNFDGVKQFIADFNPIAEKIKAAGMLFTYHMRDYEFVKLNGKFIMDHIIEGFPKDLLGIVYDTYYAQAGGVDPVFWLYKLAGQLDIIHFKDYQMLKGRKRAMAEVMEGNLNWPVIFSSCIETGVLYAMVEQDDCYGVDPFDCLRTSFNNLRGVI